MDYGRVLTRAWEITWRWKILWILGFLVGLGSGSTGSSANSANYRSGGRWDGFNGTMPDWAVAAIIAVACIAVLVGLALFVVSIIARGGLIAGVQQVEEEGSTGLGRAWRAGARRFWTLLGITVATWLPAVVLVVALIALTVISVGGAALGSNWSDPAAAFGVLAPWALCGIPLCLVMIVVFIVVSLVQIYADRAAMIEGLRWIDAIKRGWDMFRRNLGTTLVFWIIFLVIGLIVGAVIFGIVLAAVVPLIGLFAGVEARAWLIVPICGGGLILAIVLSVISAIVETFTSATWTLVYRQLLGLAEHGGPAAIPTPPTPPAGPTEPAEPAASLEL